MANTPRKFLAGLLAFVMLLGMVNVPVFADETDVAPVVIIDLTPGKTTNKSATIPVTGGELTREVEATTSEVATVIKDSYGTLTAPQSALKFDRNSTADQTAQRKVRDLYTDNGHFTDPASVTVTGAPEGYPFKYIGTGDYSGHYVSHVRVVYNEDGSIKALQHANGTTLTTDLLPTTSFDGPYDQTTGTRPLQFLLKDAAGNTFYGYCIDLETGANEGTWYTLANLEDNTYYASEEAEDHVRGIMFNGYWGTAEGEDGSLSALKEALKAAVASNSSATE